MVRHQSILAEMIVMTMTPPYLERSLFTKMRMVMDLATHASTMIPAIRP